MNKITNSSSTDARLAVRARIPITKKQIDEIDKEKGEILQLMQELKAKQSTLKSRRRKLAESLHEDESFLGKLVMDRLPPELFGLIFQYSLEEFVSPWTLAHVCRLWRRVVFDTPRLWSKIWIEMDAEPCDKIDLFILHLRCYSYFAMEQVLKHARSAPLTIRISDYSSDYRDRTTAEAWDMIEGLAGKRMQQWRSFGGNIVNQRWDRYWNDPEASLSCLQTLSIKELREPLLLLLGRTSRSLRQLNFNPTAEQLFTLIGADWIQSVEELALEPFDHSEGLSKKQLAAFLPSVPRIKSLKVVIHDPTSTDNPKVSPPVNLQFLRLTSNGVPFFSLFSANLTHLEIDLTERVTTSIKAFSIRLPHLEQLTTNGVFSLSAISVLQCPNLRRLEIDAQSLNAGSWAGQEMNDLLVALETGRCHLDPSHALFSVLSPDTTLLKLFSFMPSIKVLYVFHPPPTFWSYFYNEDHSQIIGCQNLEDLTVRCSREPQEWGIDVLELRKMARKRHELGFALKSCTLTGTYDRKHIKVDILKTQDSFKIPTMPWRPRDECFSDGSAGSSSTD